MVMGGNMNILQSLLNLVRGSLIEIERIFSVDFVYVAFESRIIL